MILASEIISTVVSALDAEGSGRYTFDRDFKPAVNFSIDYFVGVFNFAFSQKKLSEENLRELTRSRVFQTSEFSRISFDSTELGESVWSLLSISPEALVDPNTGPVVNPTPENSIFLPDRIFVSGDFFTTRLTFEQWNEGNKNIFMPGNSTLTNDFKTYAYKDFVHSKTGALPADIIAEIEIRPYLDNQIVAVTYLAYPTHIEAETDEILFPKSMTNLLVDKTLNFISLKQGDGTNLYSITEREIATVVSLMS